MGYSVCVACEPGMTPRRTIYCGRGLHVHVHGGVQHTIRPTRTAPWDSTKGVSTTTTPKIARQSNRYKLASSGVTLSTTAPRCSFVAGRQDVALAQYLTPTRAV